MDTSTLPHKRGANDTPRVRTLTLGALADATEVLKTLADQALEGATALKIVSISRWVSPLYNQYNALRGSLAARLGVRLSDGKYHIAPENVGEYRQQLSEIRARVVDPIDPGLCLGVPQLEGMQLTPVAVEALEPFLTQGALPPVRAV